MKKLCIILFASFVAGTFIGDFFQQKNVQPKNIFLKDAIRL